MKKNSLTLMACILLATTIFADDVVMECIQQIGGNQITYWLLKNERDEYSVLKEVFGFNETTHKRTKSSEMLVERLTCSEVHQKVTCMKHLHVDRFSPTYNFSISGDGQFRNRTLLLKETNRAFRTGQIETRTTEEATGLYCRE